MDRSRLTAALLASWQIGPRGVVYDPAVTWTSIVGCTAAGKVLTKTTATAAWNSGAISTRSIKSGVAGYVERTVINAGKYVIFGLSNGNTDQSYDDVDFGIHCTSTDDLRVYEKGVQKFGPVAGVIQAGDVLRVAVSAAGVVTYYRNGSLLYTSLAAPTFPLIVDCSIYTQGAQLSCDLYGAS